MHIKKIKPDNSECTIRKYYILSTLVCVELVANYPGEVVTKCLRNLASLIKSIWHVTSPSYDNNAMLVMPL